MNVSKYEFALELNEVGILVNIENELSQRFLKLEDLEVVQQQLEVIQGVHL